MTDECQSRLERLRGYAEEGLQHYSSAHTRMIETRSTELALTPGHVIEMMRPLAHILALIEEPISADSREILLARERITLRYLPDADSSAD